MNKIWILAGAVLLFVLLLGAWVFIGGFGDFANLLGDKSGDIVEANKTDLISTWVCEDIDSDNNLIGSTNRYVFLTNGKGNFGGIGGTWKISKNIINITTLQDNYYEYNYSFDTAKTSLILEKSGFEYEFMKSLEDS